MTDNNELIKRIDAALYDDADPYQALRDCRAALLQQQAEIEFKQQFNDNLRDHLAEKQAEIASLNDAAQQQAVVIERLSKPYVPMTDDELLDVFLIAPYYSYDNSQWDYEKSFERATAERMGYKWGGMSKKP
jgi:hypothetical protein